MAKFEVGDLVEMVFAITEKYIKDMGVVVDWTWVGKEWSGDRQYEVYFPCGTKYWLCSNQLRSVLGREE